MTMADERLDYAPDQRAQALDLWRYLVDSHVTRLDNGGGRWGVETVSDETIGAAVDANGDLDGGRVGVVLASYSDYGGASFDAANVRDLSGWPGVRVDSCGHGGERAWIVLGELPCVDEADDVATGIEWLAGLVETIDGLADYPIINESTWSEYETEMQDEAWDAWLRSDTMHSLDSMIDEASDGEHDTDTFPLTARWRDDPRDRDDIVREVYYTHAGEQGEWTCETATSATNLGHDETLRHVAHEVYGLPVSDCAHIEDSRIPSRGPDGRWDGTTCHVVQLPCRRPAERRGYCDQHAHRH